MSRATPHVEGSALWREDLERVWAGDDGGKALRGLQLGRRLFWEDLLLVFSLLVVDSGIITGLTRLATFSIRIILEHAESIRIVRCCSSIIIIGRLGSSTRVR